MTRAYVDIKSLIEAVKAEVPQKPLDAITVSVRLAEDLTQAGDTVVEHFVKEARNHGLSWTQIATSLGVTRQSAHKRFESVPDPQGAPMGLDGIREKPAPFCGTRMRDDGAIEVLLETGGTWYELQRVDGHPIEDLVFRARQAYGKIWLKRLSEDLDCIFELAGDLLGSSVQATLVDAAGRQLVRTVECTIAKRKAAWRANARS
jgi:hypothetical protein